MPRRAAGVPRTTIDLLVLAVLNEGPRHGYALAQAIDERSQSRARIRPGDLYRVLYRLHRAGLIEPVAARAADDERRMRYRITAEGRRVARAEAAYLRDVCAALLRPHARAGRPS